MPASRSSTRFASPGLVAACLALAVSAGCDQPLESVSLVVGHRMHPTFREVHRAAPGQRFAIGDTDYSARIVDFLPDFAIESGTKRVYSRSRELRNPAVRIEVFQGDARVDEVWAFRGEGPPHFAATSMLSFRIEELTWKPGKGPGTPASDSNGAAAPADTAGTAPSVSPDSAGKR